MAARSTDDPENSDNSDSAEDGEVNDGRNRVTIHETVATTSKPEDNPMIGSVFKEFSESYNQANENWEEPASEEVTKVVSVTFKETLSGTAFKNLLTKVNLPENCKFSQTKLVNPVAFASVSPSIRSADIKLQEVQRNMPKMTGCFIKLLSQLPSILKTNGNHKDESWRSFRLS